MTMTIPEVTIGKYQLSGHARARALEREIRLDIIRQVIDFPQVDLPDKKEPHLRVLKGYGIVVVVNPELRVIVSVYPDGISDEEYRAANARVNAERERMAVLVPEMRPEPVAAAVEPAKANLAILGKAKMPKTRTAPPEEAPTSFAKTSMEDYLIYWARMYRKIFG